MAQHPQRVELGVIVADASLIDLAYTYATLREDSYGDSTWKGDAPSFVLQPYSPGWQPPGQGQSLGPILDSRRPDEPGLPELCLKLRLLETLSAARPQVVEILFVGSVAFRWESFHGSERDDATYEVLDSQWLAEHDKNGNLLGGLSDYRHLKLNFNEEGTTLEVLCREALVRRPPQ